MWQDLAIALSLVLVIEGMLPFLSPRSWRDMVIQVTRLNNKQLRIMGLMSMLAGLILLTLLK
ncbi:DUF2065 domain-containing protein [Dasania marina]|uniref:DUF2065 domain-containing protein n=1 Tax=Dasania marina TaxID=471499 RepID=UPI00037B2E8B|nr:DUF2065 family protein [Dasania marina]|tara:strand:- start:77822 stop:78007 length:186 start_codon:yes stop_codon:yes gene_type:complete